jgi:CBS domain-containing protein
VRLREVVSADATDTVLEAVRRMDQANTGAVAVLDETVWRASSRSVI